MDDCIFCKIIQKKAEADIVYEDDVVIAFKDIRPKAPVHILIAPKEHVVDLNEFHEGQEVLLGQLLFRAVTIAKEFSIAQSGYKVITNIGDHGGQIIDHFHFHLLGGEPIKVVV